MVRHCITSSALYACAFSSCLACCPFCCICCLSAWPPSPCHWSESVTSLGRWRRSSSLCACCGAEWSVSSPASSAATSYSGGASSWSECSWTSFHGTWGRFSLCCASLEPLAASHVLAERLSSRIDLTQTASTSKAGLIVCTYDVI